MRASEPQSESEALQEELVAYLDGEVTAAERQAIEERLAEDAAYRELLLGLQRSWRWLDRLPTAHADESFTKSTIEMVSVKAEQDGPRGVVGGRHLPPWLWRLAGLAAAAAIGYVALAIPLHWRRQSALKDLPVIYHLDLYRQVDSIEFLRLLDEAELFEEEDEDVP